MSRKDGYYRRMVIRESTSFEISSFLKSDDLFDAIEFLTKDCYETCLEVYDICQEKFENITLPKITRVQVLKISDTDYDILDSDYYVIEYNNKFYDYCAYKYFEDIFNISEYNMPIIQPILSSPNLIHSTVSTLKNYVLIKYNQGLMK